MSTPSALPRGTRLHGGAYALGPVLGQGGFGITYKGGDLSLKRYVAIKEYFPPGALRHNGAVVANDAEKLRAGVAEFLGEARVLSRFNHPGIVGVIGTFEENQTAYMVMEFLEGETLEARIAAKGRLDEWEALDIGSRLAGALEIVHHAGLLHRDIKPDNVILRRSSGATLIDFGTARAFADGSQKMTQIVTPGYAPLEQYASNARRGPASDLYALAATLYHALSGTKPVAATDRAADVPLPDLQQLVPTLTPMFAGAIMSALQMEIARRPQTAREFEAQLKGQKSPTRRPPPPPPPSARPPIPATPAPAGAPAMPMSVASGVEASGIHPAGQTLVLRNQTLERHSAPVLALAYAPDGQSLVSAGQDSKICVWTPHNTLNPQTTAWSAHSGGVLALAYSPDGALLASGGRDERIHIWDGANLAATEKSPLATLKDCDGVVRDLAFCPARRELVVADAGAVTLWNADSGGIAARRTGGAVAVAWAPDGSALAVGGVMDGALQLWNGADLSERGRVAAHQGAITDIAWSPDGARIATSGSDGKLRVWLAAHGTLEWELTLGGVPECVDWSPDGQVVAVGKGDSVSLRIAQGALYRNYSLRKVGSTLGRGRINRVLFSPLPRPPQTYALACAVQDNTVDVCSIRAQRDE